MFHQEGRNTGNSDIQKAYKKQLMRPKTTHVVFLQKLEGEKKRQKTPLLKSCIIMWKLHAFVGQLRWMNCILRLAAAPNTVKLILFSVPQKKSYLQARVSVIKTWKAPWVASIDWCYSRETSIAINLLNIQVEIGCICPFA